MLPIALLFVIGCAAAQVITPCVGPKSFTGRFRRMDRERRYYVEGRIYYDEENRRIREFEFEDINRERGYYDKLKLYNLGVEYTVDLRTRKCNTSTPRPSTWRPYGVPPDARFQGEGTLGEVGQPNEGVTIAFFGGEYEGRDPYFVAVTQPNCFPVQFGFFSNSSGFFHHEFYDLVSGITEPEAFIPPAECVQ